MKEKEILLGKLIGLMRTTSSHEKSEHTDRVILGGLILYDDPQVTKEEVEGAIESVINEKRIIAPGCFTCASPCGNTDDYDLRIMDGPDYDAELRDEKRKMIGKLCTLAYAEYDNVSRGGELSRKFCQALFLLGEEDFKEEIVKINKELLEICSES